MKLTEQVVVISGASRGLGAEIARAFGREGAKVVVNYFQNEEKAAGVAKSIGENAITVRADVRNAEEVRDMFRIARETFGKPVTTIVHNALVNFKFDPVGRSQADAIEWDEYERQLTGSVKGGLNLIQAGLEEMKKAEFGRIVTIGTNLFQNPVVPYHDYTTAKAALLGFTRNMANELGAFGITVNMVSGGLLQTTDASSLTTPEVFGLIESVTPRRKVTEPAEVADAVLFFASPWGRAVTGQNLVVDGGLVMD
ncbi:3-oxoacyl-ACP reductase [Ammoniphilus resinae]|nr:3-oxoacyl-ACP reductase [Ammoniphilus resinae]